MKNLKIRNKKSKSTTGGSGLMSVILLLAFACLAAFVWFAWQYQQSSRRVDDMRQTVDRQANLVNGFASLYAQTLQGGSAQAKKLKSDVAAFSTYLQKENSGSGVFAAPNSAQKKLLADVGGSWRKLKPSLDAAVSAADNVFGVQQSSAALSIMISEIKLKAKRVKDSLDPFQDSEKLSADLDAVVAGADKVESLVQGLQSGGGEAGNAASAIGAQIQNLSRLGDAANAELKNRGTIVFNTPKGASEAKKLTDQMAAFKADSKKLTALLPQFVQAMQSDSDIDGRITALNGSLLELKSTYNDSAGTADLFGLSIGYTTLLAVLLLLGLLLLGFWTYLQIRRSSQLQQEATRLRLAAEKRTENDQEAILRLMDDLADLSEGDLTIEAQVTEDFTGAIADSINFTVENMRDMVGTITHTSREINSATENSQNVSRLLAESSEQQSSQIGKTTDTANQMATSLNNVAENTDASVEIARSSVNIAHEGRERVRSTIKSMTDIRENIQDTSKRIKRLGESSQEIGDIVEIIKGIADQTNVLALNAAIQATSAGEAGRGFAVVADEVQRLAERSANATKRIEVLVKTIQADANEAVASMENSTKEVVTGAGIAEQAGHSLDQIENVSKNLANLIVNVSNATRKAASMAGDVAENMGGLSALNKNTVSDITTSVQSVENLQALSTTLKDSISGFKLPG